MATHRHVLLLTAALAVAAASSVKKPGVSRNGGGGVKAAPYAVQVEVLYPSDMGGVFEYRGAGVLVDSKHVLTAAHNVADVQTKETYIVQVRAGSELSEHGGVVADVSHVQLNPNWRTVDASADVEYGVGDVAVLTLAKPFALGGAVQAAKLAPVCTPLPANTHVTVSSWGVLNVNSSVASPKVHTKTFAAIPQARCDELMQKHGARVLPGQFCTQANPKNFLCHGDSGTGGARVSDGLVLGVFSWSGCGQDDIPSVFEDITDKGVRAFVDAALKKYS